MTTIIGIALIAMALFLVVSVLMQNGKDHRLSGSIAGGAETFFGKTKAKSANAILSKLTTIITIIFVILVLVLYIIQPEVDLQALMDEAANDAEVSDTVETEDDANAENEVVVDDTVEDGTTAEGNEAVEGNETTPVEDGTADNEAVTEAE